MSKETRYRPSFVHCTLRTNNDVCMLLRLSVLEIFLLQVAAYAALWLWDEFVASYVCLILPVVIAAILLISWIADLIEPARIGRKYFIGMLLSVIAPLLVTAFFYYIYGGQIAWLNPV